MKYWHQVLPNRIYDLHYELLTENQEEETRNLMSHLGLEWDDACLSPEHNKRVVATASNVQVRQKVYQGSSEKWKLSAFSQWRIRSSWGWAVIFSTNRLRTPVTPKHAAPKLRRVGSKRLSLIQMVLLRYLKAGFENVVSVVIVMATNPRYLGHLKGAPSAYFFKVSGVRVVFVF